MEILQSISELNSMTRMMRENLVAAMENGREEAFLKETSDKLAELDESSLEYLVSGMTGLPIDAKLFYIIRGAHSHVKELRMTAERYKATPGFGRF